MFVFKVHEERRVQNDRFCQLYEQCGKKWDDKISGMQEKQQALIERISQTHDEQKWFNQTLIEILKRQESRQTDQAQANAVVSPTSKLWMSDREHDIHSEAEVGDEWPEASVFHANLFIVKIFN